jgi:hypothetical protein
MPPLSTAANEVVGAVRGVMGLSGEHRLRDQLRETVELFERAKSHPELESAQRDLAHAIDVKAARLRSIAEAGTQRTRDLGQALAGLFFVMILYIPAKSLWPHRETWWGLLLLAVIGLFATACLVTAAQAVRLADRVGSDR